MLVLAFAVAIPSAAQPASASPTPWREPRITFIDQPTPRAQEMIRWAVEQYRRAGLQLPDVEVSFPTFCGGKAALYHVGQGAIDFCFINKHTMLHELAHAWDDTSGAVDHQAFLELRGLHVWWGGTDMPSEEQGAEQLARIIDWGLSGEEPRLVPHFPHNSLPELKAAFDMLTGRGVVTR